MLTDPGIADGGVDARLGMTMTPRPFPTFLLRAIVECFARLSHGLGVCPFVRPSVTLLYCVKTVQARITKSSLWPAPRTLVFRGKNFVPVGTGVPLERGRQKGVPLKRWALLTRIV